MNSFRVRGCNNRRRGAREFWNSGKQKNGSGDRASPMIVQAALRCGSDRRAVNDQAAVFVYLLTLIPRGLGIKVEAKCRNMVAARSSACSPLSCAVIPYPCCSDIYPYMSGSAGVAKPRLAYTWRPNSLVSDRANTQKVISPGLSSSTPSSRVITWQRGGKMDDT